MDKETLISKLLDWSWQKHAQLGLTPSKLPNVFISHRTLNQNFEQTIYQPCIVFVLQGLKRVNFGDRLLSYGAGEFLAMAAHIPASFCVGSDEFSAITLLLDRKILCEVCQELGEYQKDIPVTAMTTAECSQDMLECLLRIVQCEDNELKSKCLFKLYLRELYFYLLQTPAGQLLCQFGYQDSPNSQILEVIGYIREHFTEILRMEDLAKLANMSMPTFFRRFRQLTLISPLQYQKAFQLHQARSLLLQQGASLSQIALQVGYASQQQFTREYKRFFGITPGSDLSRVQADLAAYPTLVSMPQE